MTKLRRVRVVICIAKMNFKRNTLVISAALMVILVLVVFRSGGNGGTLACSAFTVMNMSWISI